MIISERHVSTPRKRYTDLNSDLADVERNCTFTLWSNVEGDMLICYSYLLVVYITEM